MTRQRITKAKRVRVFDAAKGICHLCGHKIDEAKESWDVEHVKPLWLNGADSESNMKPAHKDCHAVKSASESAPRAKGTRIRARHIGIRAKSTIGRRPTKEKSSPRYYALRAMREQQYARGRR